MEQIDRIFRSNDTIKRLQIIDDCLVSNTIKLKSLMINFYNFLELIKKEDINPDFTTLKQTRIWLYHNIIKVLRSRLIDPNANNDICVILQKYTYILEIFYNLNRYIENDSQKNIHMISFLIGIFFVIDEDITTRCYSRLEITQYIYDINTTAIKINNISKNLLKNNESVS